MTNIPAVRAFCEAWTSRDAEKIAALMTEDCFYHNVPMEPVVGRPAITQFIRGFLGDAQTVDFEILSIAEAEDGTVLTERVDHFDYGGRRVALPVMGSFKLKDGLVARWLDYFDMAPFAGAAAE
ncbi:limonene-1,2-epoxide hydrolase [Sphingomonas laterariae]|uniref:Limonene-1,2-epoxide hydrolase n=1 Tax=Edaphosphingomonas laterariae TaxID=861865 RepID=A0A239EJK2_9SPHN|nr:limonene-1,2-epoxide hydrolase family protein [Sphingomonas laterariae]SNS44203.1 limonene-1,2-epoxide hydrolase [Sphingomonas laterariae]